MTFLTRASLKNRLIVGLTTLAIAVLGLFSMGALKQELMPSMQVPMAFVSVQSQGLAPEEMARTVTEPVEQALSGVPGITNVTSTTSTGSADITVEWPFDESEEDTLQAIRAAADALKPTFPTGTEVQVFSGGASDMPAMVLTAGSAGDETEFGDALAQSVVPTLQGVSGVKQVTLSGREEERIVIDLRPEDMTRLKVSVEQIAPVLESHSAALPAGEAESPQGPLSITVGGALTSVEEIAALPIAVENGVVRISDFADVTTETVPSASISRVNGQPALTLQIIPAQGANVVDISHAVTAELDAIAPSLQADFVTLFDQAPYIEQSIHDLSVEGGLGLLFAVLVILAFLGSWRSTLIAAVSIPLSLLITLVGLWWSGNTLNILTLGALTIAIGRVVDDSIVVIENISRRRGSGPLTPAGVVASVRQVAGAITASTLTTVAVFLPIAFVSGMAGQLFRPFAVTVSIALLASLVVAMTIVPVLAFLFMRNRAPHGATAAGTDPAASTNPAAHPGTAALADTTEADGPSDLDEIHTAPDRLQRALMPALNATRRHPVITLVTSGLILVSTLVMSTQIPTDFLGSSGNESLQVSQVPEAAGTDLVAAAEPVEAALADVPGIRDVITSIPLATAAGPATITYDLQLEDGSDTEVVSAAVDSALGSLTESGELQMLTQDAFVGGAAGSGIALQIRGNDPVALRAASDLLETQLGEESGVQSVTSELAGEQPVVRVRVDEVKAAQLGFDRTTIARAVQVALEGQQVGKMMLEGQERSIVVRTPGSERTAELLGEIVLPVTPQQTAAAQKLASETLEAKAKAEAEDARLKANSELTHQINTAIGERAELVSQISALSEQLAMLQAMPVVPEEPRTPEDEAAIRAQQERMEQIAALEGAIAGAQGGLTGIDEQVAMLRESQTEAANQLAQQQAAEAEQKAAIEVTGTAIALQDIAVIEEELTAPTITRADGERQVMLTVTPKKGQLDAANAAVERAISTADLPAGVSFELGGVSAEQDDAFMQLGAAMLAAIMLVLLVMVATFRSFRGPLVLLISIPFAATGAILGLLITGTPLGLPALIGLLMLIGIVVTNAIVLMDLVNRLRESGASLTEAVEHGTRLRLRPILMTAAATIFALVPMSLGLTGGGVFISKPLAIVVIGGLISSTLLTLILVPILYTLVERRRERKLAKRGARQERRAARRAERDEAREAQRALKRGEATAAAPDEA
ncbi:efflux RND transporter permease subunit [Leucobacter rhizosphaerae]|uniref:Efflux RND transporter permease subunit n=1 Tax=Leucobacter rhizosphaerae TaxID=2932245 RepID=A0ABY4FSN2_9MICO|nr:efflux RND transporter permease subunit [Leucobacter rhizosphaerae]UOQ59257.1 efflux RND transporter permease subunit [Leucobacter rhizosphaerae]